MLFVVATHHRALSDRGFVSTPSNQFLVPGRRYPWTIVQSPNAPVLVGGYQECRQKSERISKLLVESSGIWFYYFGFVTGKRFSIFQKWLVGMRISFEFFLAQIGEWCEGDIADVKCFFTPSELTHQKTFKKTKTATPCTCKIVSQKLISLTLNELCSARRQIYKTMKEAFKKRLRTNVS